MTIESEIYDKKLYNRCVGVADLLEKFSLKESNNLLIGKSKQKVCGLPLLLKVWKHLDFELINRIGDLSLFR